MTTPVQEPNANRDLAGLGWGERQLARRPAQPTAPAAGGVPTAIFSGWSYTSTNLVPTDAWTNVCSLAGGDGFFTDIYMDVAFHGTYNAATGTFNLNNGYFYWATGWAQMADNFADEDQFGIALNCGGGYRIANMHEPFAPGSIRFMVAGPVGPSEVFTSGVKLEIFHSHGSDMTLDGARLCVIELGPIDANQWFTYP